MRTQIGHGISTPTAVVADVHGFLPALKSDLRALRAVDPLHRWTLKDTDLILLGGFDRRSLRR
jgi:hypothetical protein